MTREQFAALLNGREYRSEMTAQENDSASNSGLLVVYGASDDLTEFGGVIYDEAGACDGATHRIGANMRLLDEPRDDHDELIEAGWTPPQVLMSVKAEWCPEGFDGSWRISFDGPHSKFNIMEDGELYCEGVVIDVAEAAKGGDA